MANEQHIPHYSAADFERYQQGKMSASEMHQLEKAALEDPFLADALSGYAVFAPGEKGTPPATAIHGRPREAAPQPPSPSMQSELADLQDRLQKRLRQTSDTKVIPLDSTAPSAASSRSYTWLRVAAMVVIVAGAAFLTYEYGFKKENAGIAMEEPVAADKPAGSDTNTTAAKAVNAEEGASALQRTEPAPAGAAGAVQGSATDTVAGDAPALLPEAGNEGLISKTSVPAKANARPAAAAPSLPSQSESLVTADTENESSGARKKETAKAGVLLNKEAITAKQRSAQKAAASKLPVNNGGVEDKDASQGWLASAEPAASSRNNAIGYNVTKGASGTNIFRGRVTDQSNNALPFAKITNMRDSIGTYSDVAGNFVLISPDSTLDVRVRSLGFESQSVALQNGRALSENRVVMQDAKDDGSQIVIGRQQVNAERNDRSINMQLMQAEPVDGWRNYNTYVANNLNVPETYRTRPTSTGEVELMFDVDANGAPVNITVTRSLCESCDREAIRLLKEGPKWKRKSKDGRSSVTISF